MTDPEDKPSFLARLAIVVTIGALAWQIVLGFVALLDKINDGKAPANAAFFVGVCPTLAYFTVGGLYYLFKGKPTNADAVISSRLYRVWVASALGGAIYFFLI